LTTYFCRATFWRLAPSGATGVGNAVQQKEAAMSDLREEFLGRLTWAGWALIALDGLGIALLGPYLLFKFSPAALALLAAHRRLMGLAWIAIVGGVFVLGKWLLERCGITILRACEEGKQNAPPPQDS
jgi:hypothetical protein